MLSESLEFQPGLGNGVVFRGVHNSDVDEFRDVQFNFLLLLQFFVGRLFQYSLRHNTRSGRRALADAFNLVLDNNLRRKSTPV